MRVQKRRCFAETGPAQASRRSGEGSRGQCNGRNGPLRAFREGKKAFERQRAGPSKSNPLEYREFYWRRFRIPVEIRQSV